MCGAPGGTISTFAAQKMAQPTSRRISGEPMKTTNLVLVVGAGPTGLAAALDLARFSIPVRLIDVAPEPASHSRAIAIQPRTLEMFAQRDAWNAFSS